MILKAVCSLKFMNCYVDRPVSLISFIYLHLEATLHFTFLTITPTEDD